MSTLRTLRHSVRSLSSRSILSSPLILPIGLLVLFVSPSLAGVPYDPTRIFTTDDGRAAYIYSPRPSTQQIDVRLLNISDSIDAQNPLVSIISSDLPFQDSTSSSTTSPAVLTPIFNKGNLSVLVAGCQDDASQAELWHFTQNREGTTGTWDELSLSPGTWDTSSLSSTDFPSSPSIFLSAGFTFSPTASPENAAFYIFGGMCPDSSSSSAAGNWTSNASYSAEMIKVSPNPSSLDAYPKSTYSASILESRGPPVAEAGLTITPLTTTYFKSGSTSSSQQQNFALIGGHTENAFINMSQIAVFSLPEESWSFEAINQPKSDKADLMARSGTGALEVEPRSGHTAVLTPEGDKIVVFGGWVGDISTPAEPQLAILEIGQGYGGTGEWTWTIPSVAASPFQSGQGIYGHGAAMLPGGVMLISGGYSISSSSSPDHSSRMLRQVGPVVNEQMMLFDPKSASFVTTYTNPTPSAPTGSSQDQSDDSDGGAGVLRTPSQKAGLGVGIVLGVGAVAATAAFYFFYSRRLRQRRAIREKELRDLALGADRFYSGDLMVGGVDGRGGFGSGSMRSASWGSRQERNLFGPTDEVPWIAPGLDLGPSRYAEHVFIGNGEREAERTGLLLDLPSPTRGLRRSMHPKGPSYSSLGIGAPGSSPYGPSVANGDIHTIAEQDEESEGDQAGGGESLQRRKASRTEQKESGLRSRPNSDPFKDPPPQLTRSQSEMDRMRREREIQGWVDDWEAAGAAMDSGRTCRRPSSASVSKNEHGHSSSNGNGNTKNNHNATGSRSDSPEKSDRTNSNLSEQSTMSSSSIQRSLLGSISRNVSMRSASAGYVMFANAAAAMTGRATLINHPGPHSSVASSTEGNKAKTGGGVDRTSSLSKRSASLNLNSSAPTRQKTGTGAGAGDGAGGRERTNTFSSMRSNFGPSQPWEQEGLLSSGAGGQSSSPTRTGNHWQSYDDGYVFATPPESPVKERHASSATAAATAAGASSSAGGKKAVGWVGSVKRALTGTGSSAADVQRRVAEYESKGGNTSKQSQSKPQMREMQNSDHQQQRSNHGGGGDSPRRAVSASAALWRSKKGAKDWDADPPRDMVVEASEPSSSFSAAAGPTIITTGTAGTTSTPTASTSASASTTIPTSGPTRTKLRRKPLARDPSTRPSIHTVDTSRHDPLDDHTGNCPGKNIAGQANVGHGDGDETEEWDVEAAAENRLVQVMFTVPREKLRVVNADLDAASLRSEGSEAGQAGQAGGDEKDGNGKAKAKRVSM